MLYRIADLTVEMDIWGRAHLQAEEYRDDNAGTPDFTVIADPTKLHEKFPNSSLDDCEYVSSGNNFYRQLLRYDGMMLHSSAVMMDGYAYLFSANPGTGKSTHTALWQEVFGKDRAKILNDDKPALRIRDGVVYAYGTPWSGKTNLNINTSVPVAGICILERGEKNSIAPFSGTDAIFAIFEQTYRPRDPNIAPLVLENLDKILRKVPVWKLKCNMEPEAAMVSYQAMRPKCD